MSSASPTPAPPMYIPSLDGLRAFSIIVVFLGHAGAGRLVPGGFGVTVFFVVSGYLITTLLRLELLRTDAVDIRGFYTRRVFRILPLFYFVLAAMVLGTLLFGLGRGTVDVAATFAQFFHVSNYWSITQSMRGWFRPVMMGTGVYWSLAIEEHFYLGFPLLIKALNARHWSYVMQGRLLAVICAIVLAWRGILVYLLDAPEVRTYYSTDTRIDSILIGCIVALVANPMLDQLAVPRVTARRALIGVVAILATFAVRDPGLRESVRYTIQSIGVAYVLMYVVSAPSTLAGSILNWRPAVWFGRLSYAFYLTHLVLIFEFQKHLGTVQAAVAAFIASTLLSMVLQRFVEQPGIAMRKKWTKRTAQRTAAKLVSDRV